MPRRAVSISTGRHIGAGCLEEVAVRRVVACRLAGYAGSVGLDASDVILSAPKRSHET
jgi:hypothetical protein